MGADWSLADLLGQADVWVQAHGTHVQQVLESPLYRALTGGAVAS